MGRVQDLVSEIQNAIHPSFIFSSVPLSRESPNQPQNRGQPQALNKEKTILTLRLLLRENLLLLVSGGWGGHSRVQLISQHHRGTGNIISKETYETETTKAHFYES